MLGFHFGALRPQLVSNIEAPNQSKRCVKRRLQDVVALLLAKARAL